MIRIADIPNDPKCGVCQICMDKDYSSLEEGRKSVRCKKMILFSCTPIVEGNYCLEHGKQKAIEVKKYIDNMVEKILKTENINHD
jgi:hypothetical protein